MSLIYFFGKFRPNLERSQLDRIFPNVLNYRISCINNIPGIYRIDHLWILPNLTDLNLSCNNIQFIENLNCLPNLVKLNLACNQIKKIEQIDQLLQLEIFMIHNNRISVLENFHASKRLKMFNIRNNVIEDLEESVLYLRKFKGLKSLCITGNPCCDKVDSIERFVKYLVTVFCNLVPRHH